MSSTEVRNCIEIIEPYLTELRQQADPRVQIMGGVAAAAFLSDKSFIDLEGNFTCAPLPDITNIRPDGSRRDLDALVLSTDSAFVDTAARQAESAIDGQLVVNFFDLKPAERLRQQAEHPYASLARVHLGDRYVTQAPDQHHQTRTAKIISGRKSVFPFSVDMPPESLDSHQIYYDGYYETPLPTAHPGMMIANYLTRSISGLRPKDSDKVNQFASAACKSNPEIKTWLFDGPGKDMMHLAQILHTLRSPSAEGDRHDLVVGTAFTLPKLSLKSLRENPAFMLRDSSGTTQRIVLAATRAKARGLHFAESQQGIVSFWQKHVETHADTVIKN